MRTAAIHYDGAQAFANAPAEDVEKAISPAKVLVPSLLDSACLAMYCRQDEGSL